MDDIKNLVQLWRSRGMTLSGIADRLTANGIRNGEKPYNARTVRAMLPAEKKASEKAGLTRDEQRRRRYMEYDHLRPFMRFWKDKGLTLNQIAERLNKAGNRTVTGKLFSKGQISVLLRRPTW